MVATTDSFALFDIPSGKRIAEGEWPAREEIVGALDDVVVTRRDGVTTLFRLSAT
ncbi:MAG: hypothetical protein R3B72_20840 [Polyangiaceae bacterium]